MLFFLFLFASGDPFIDSSDKQTEKVASVFFFLLPITHLKSLSAGVSSVSFYAILSLVLPYECG